MQEDPQRDHVVDVQQHVGHSRLRGVRQVVDGHRLPAADFDDAWGERANTHGGQQMQQLRTQNETVSPSC